MRRVKSTLLVLAVIVLIGPGLAAQQSNTSAVTNGIFQTSTDHFMSVFDWSKIPEQIWYLGLNSSQLDAGTGMKLGGLYVGARYYGDGLEQNTPAGTTAMSSQYLLDSNRLIVGEQITTTLTDVNVYDDSANSGSLLLGLGALGIKASVQQSGYSQLNRFTMIGAPNTATTAWTNLFTTTGVASDSMTEVYDASDTLIMKSTTTYSDGADSYNSLTPGVQVGTEVPVGEAALKPWIYAGASFLTDSFSTTETSYDQAIGSGNPTYPATGGITDAAMYRTESFGYDQNRISISGAVGASWESTNENGSETVFGLTYVLGLPIYSNSYLDTTGTAKTVAGFAADYSSTSYTYTASGPTTTTTRAFELSPRTEIRHTITPSYRYRTPVSEQLALGFQLAVNAQVVSSTTERTGGLVETTVFDSAVDPSLDSTTTTTKTYTGTMVSASSFDIAPSFTGGLQFALVPKVLTLNAGFSAALPRLYSSFSESTRSGITTRTVVETMGTGAVSTDTYEDTLDSARNESRTEGLGWNDMNASVSGGLAFSLGGGVTLDLMMSTSGMSLNMTNFTAQLGIVK